MQPSPLIRTLTLAVVCLVLAGCGGSSGESSGPSSSSPRTAPATTSRCCVTTTTAATTDAPTAPAPQSSTTASPTTGGCDASTMPLERQAALMVFAEVANQSQVTGAVGRGAGGVFIGTGATGLLQTDTFQSTVVGAHPQPFVATDEEGGRVQRLASVIGSLPSARTMHATMTPAEITGTVQRHAEKMRRLGVTMDFAPDADVSDESDHEVIGDRSFSNDPQAATTDAVAFAKGLQAAGVTPVFKHFPGHGHGSGDSHTGLVTTPPLSSLRTSDLIPYTTGLSQVPGVAVMVGHLIVPDLTGGQPASVSRAAITGLVRDEIGFDGLVITDDLGAMKGILDVYGTPSAAAIQAAKAGADLLLVPAGSMDAVVDGIVAEVGSGKIDRAQISASANRILRALPGNRCG